ncbi:chemotaxis protein CheD [Solirhodobacter olei]|uniref:chemotaxis protein CheD n=1 Tax=Solirhodobacter olei TaxID=2493082 RepID=UPI000FDA6C79|nr:chemotaxis protein CheD [Solirhodobacter olei]
MTSVGEAAGKVYHVVQGNFLVSGEEGAAFTTILGSCVATCFHDPTARIGGMNHFLLPDGAQGGGELLRYGLHAMELLINAMLKAGAQKGRLQAKLFGGAAMHDGMRGIGKSNAEFARRFLATEGIPCVGESLGGTQGRRLRYWPTTGRAQLRLMDSYEPVPAERPAPFARTNNDDLTLF